MLLPSRHDPYRISRRKLVGAAVSAPVLLALARGARSEESPQPMSFVRAASASDVDAHAAFGWEVLNEVLERTRASHGDYTLAVSPDPAQAVRFRHPENNTDIQVNVVILTPAPDWNDYLLPVRIPLLRGLLGYRLLLVHRKDLDRFAGIETLADLRGVTFGSVKHWVDTTIMKAAGIPVVTGTTYDGLFKMLQAHRFEALSRGVHQIDAEMTAIEAAPGNDIVVEPHLLLHYFLPVYFWFSKDKEGRRRAERVRSGLTAMVADGSLERMFDAAFGPVIEKYGLARRTVIELANPQLSPEDPVGDSRLWYRPPVR